MLQMFPELFSQIKVREVAGYPRNLRRSLAATHPPATNSSDAAVIAVLPLGMYNSAFYEHAFLVGQMGAGLIEGHDLRVVDGLIVMRTTQGYKAIDVQIYEANSLQCGPRHSYGRGRRILQHDLEYLGRTTFYSLPTYTFDD
jgi:uncharacterized circularly permuted ATP-grasp superfamily protein